MDSLILLFSTSVDYSDPPIVACLNIETLDTGRSCIGISCQAALHAESMLVDVSELQSEPRIKSGLTQR